MAISICNDLMIDINDDGYLVVSCDKGCTWKIVGKVKGDKGDKGDTGATGSQGPCGNDGANGTDGDCPYISSETGCWVCNGEDTGVSASGKDCTIVIGTSSDIGNVGTPSVTTTTSNGQLVLYFHNLKGNPGTTPIITVDTDTANNQLVFKVDGVTKATLPIPVMYSAGEGINISAQNAIGVNPATSFTLGGVKLVNSSIQTVTAESPSETSGRTYPVQLNSNNEAVVNVPWSNTDEKQKVASSTSKIYLTGITTSPTATEVAQKGVASTKLYVTNGYLYSQKNISHNLETKSIDATEAQDHTYTYGIDYNSTKYHLITTNYEGVLRIDLKGVDDFDGCRDVVVRIVNNGRSGYTLGVVVESSDSSVSIANLFDIAIMQSSVVPLGYSLAESAVLELVFTFYGTDDVTLKGFTTAVAP